MHFFEDMEIFSHWDSKDLKNFIMFIEKKVIYRNHILFREGDESESIYFIKSGEFEVFIHIKNQ